MERAIPQDEESPSGVVLGAGDRTALRLAARVLDTAPVPIAYVSPGLIVLQCNAAAARLFGVRGVDILGRPMREAAPGSRLLASAREASETHRPVNGILRTGSGAEVAMTCTPDIDAKGRLLGLLVTDASQGTASEDVAIAEKALKDRETLFRTIFEMAPAGVCKIDAGGRFVRVNRRLAEMLGYPIARLRQMSWADITHHEDAAASAEALKGLVARERDEVTLEKRYICSDGTALWALTSLAAIRAEDGSLHQIVGVIQDISEHKHAEALAAACSRIDAAIHSTLDFTDMMQRVIVEAVEALRCDSARVALHEGDLWVTRVGYHLPPGTEDDSYADETVPEYVTATRKRRVLAIDDAQNDVRADGDRMRSAGIRSLLVVPLVSRDRVVGVISFAYRSREKRFSVADISFGDHVASSATVALENARLYDTQHMLADTLQDAMVRMPESVPGIDFCSLYRSATEEARVGGDFLDVFPLEDGRVALLIGDVSGKGVQAAALTTLMKNVIRAYAYEDASPARVMERLNRTIERETEDDMFATAFLAVLDPLTGWLTYCCAGHPSAMIRRVDGTLRTLGSHSPLVGAVGDLAYVEGYEQVGAGDILLLVSDGVLEARDNSRELFAEQRLCAALTATAGIRTVCQDVFEAVSSFSAGELKDDVAILAITLDTDPPPIG